MKPLRPESKALFRAGRAAFEPTRDDRLRIDRAVAGAVGGGLLASAGAAAGATVTGAAAAAPLVSEGATVAAVAGASGGAAVGNALGGAAIAKWILVAAVVATAGGLGASALRTAPAPGAPPVAPSGFPVERLAATAPPPVAPARPPPAPLTTAVAAPIATPVTKPAPHAARVERETSISVADAARLLHDADDAIRAGDLARAGQLLDAYDARFPRGVLGEERDAERAIRSCAGAEGETRARALARFADAHPDSPLAARVRAACP